MRSLGPKIPPAARNINTRGSRPLRVVHVTVSADGVDDELDGVRPVGDAIDICSHCTAHRFVSLVTTASTVGGTHGLYSAVVVYEIALGKMIDMVFMDDEDCHD